MEQQNNMSQCKRNHSHRTRLAGSLSTWMAVAGLSLVAALSIIVLCPEPSQARHIVAPIHPNQFFLNQFCDLNSKAPINRNKQKQDQETQISLNHKNLFNSMRVRPANGISFGFDSNAQVPKQLNCFFVVVAPKSHGLLLNVNSIGLPKNLTKLTITLNHETNHSQQVELVGQEKPSSYLLTQDSYSKIAIHLQSFQPIDWSHISFDILFTVYRKANAVSGCPNQKWFDCGDNICVPASLVCDKTPNCPNGNDEMLFYKCYSSLFWSVAASIGLALILIVVLMTVLLIKRRGKTNMNKQQSLSDNVLTADADYISIKYDSHSQQSQQTTTTNNNNKPNNGKKQTNQQQQASSYLRSNLYFNGFENPVWTNSGTLPKKLKQSDDQADDYHSVLEYPDQRRGSMGLAAAGPNGGEQTTP